MIYFENLKPNLHFTKIINFLFIYFGIIIFLSGAYMHCVLQTLSSRIVHDIALVRRVS